MNIAFSPGTVWFPQLAQLRKYAVAPETDARQSSVAGFELFKKAAEMTVLVGSYYLSWVPTMVIRLQARGLHRPRGSVDKRYFFMIIYMFH